MTKIIFTDPTGSFDHFSDTLANELIRHLNFAQSNIQIHGYSLTEFTNKNEIFYKKLKQKLDRGVKLSIFGNEKKDLLKIADKMFTKYNKDHENEDIVSYYYYTGDEEETSFHLKAIVIDDKYLYIGSANISQRAMEKNVEVGLIVEDGKKCKQFKKFIKHLLDNHLLKKIEW